MEESPKPTRRTAWQTIWRQFFTGILTVIPLAATILILKWVFETVDNLLAPLLKLIFGRQITGLGFVVTIILIYVAGVVAGNFFGKRMIVWAESLIEKIPVIKQLYGGAREITNSLSNKGKSPFMQVVLVEWPKPGMKTVALVTKETIDKNSRKLLNILISSVPNPATGFLEITWKNEVVPIDISVNDALKLMLSLGKVAPQDVGEELAEASDKLAKMRSP